MMKDRLRLVGGPGESHRDDSNHQGAAPKDQAHLPAPARKPQQAMTSQNKGTRHAKEALKDNANLVRFTRWSTHLEHAFQNTVLGNEMMIKRRQHMHAHQAE